MSIRTNKRRISHMFYRRFNGKILWMSAEEKAWLEVVPVGREFGSPDYGRLEILDLYAWGQISSDVAMSKLEIDSLDELNQQMQAAGLAIARLNASDTSACDSSNNNIITTTTITL